MKYDHNTHPLPYPPMEKEKKRTNISLFRSLICCVFILATAIPWGARCNPQNSHDSIYLSLDSCLAEAQRNHAKIRSAQYDLLQAKETKAAAFTKFFPTLSGNAIAFHSCNYLLDIHTAESGANIDISANLDGVNYDGSALEQEIQRQFGDVLDRVEFDAHLQMLDHGFFVGLAAIQPLFAGGRIVNGNKLAQLGIDVAEVQLLMSQDEVELNTLNNYYRVVALHEKKKVVDHGILLLDSLLRDAEAANEAGIIGRNDLLKVRLKRNELISAQLQLESGIILSTKALLQCIGRNFNDTEAHSFLFDDLSSVNQQVVLSTQNTIQNRPEYSLLEAANTAEQLKKRMLIGETLPQLALGATYGGSNLASNNLKWNGMVFATLQVPISAWWEASHNIKKHNLASQKQMLAQQEAIELMTLQQEQSANELTAASQQLTLSQQALSDAIENEAEVHHYYDAGMLGISDLLESQMLVQKAHSDVVDAQVDFQLKLARYRQLNPTTRR